MFVDTGIGEILILERNKLPLKYFWVILNKWIALPTKYMKFNVPKLNWFNGKWIGLYGIITIAADLLANQKAKKGNVHPLYNLE